MSITSWLKPYFNNRYKYLKQCEKDADKIQRATLLRMIKCSTNTIWGKKYNYASIRDYETFAQRVPISSYEELKAYIDRMRHGESDVLWSGTVKWYAKSSGTTNDKSKFIPVSKQGLKDTHYAGGKDVVTYYLHNNPKSRLFDGKSLILGGSHQPNYDVPESLVGDLSAILIENVPSVVNLTRVPKKETALLSDFEIKRDRIAKETLNRNVTNLSGVPSWMMSVLSRTLEVAGKKDISEVWPNLEVFFHGGVAFTPYRERYKEMITSSKMHYMETYNASEGFFGIQNDPNDNSMLLMTNYGVFYEFIPFDELDKPSPEAIPLWKVGKDKNYAMVISTTSGLWRYMIGDTIKFTSLRPYKFIISGRTKSFINAFGEELIVDNAENGIKEACEKTGAEVQEYTAAPVFMDANAKCYHQWLIEFRKKPESIDEFAEILDKSLQQINSDYEAKRSKNITLQQLQIVEAKQGLFDEWLKSKGKLGGQHKIPRLCNNRDIIEEIIALNE